MDACRVCFKRESLRRTIPIALVVGTVLIALNHGDRILSGDAETATWIRAGTNFLVPFIVSNLGLLAGRTATAELAGADSPADPLTLERPAGV